MVSRHVWLQEGCRPPARTVSSAFAQKKGAAALPQIPLHGLGHTYATLALSCGVDPRVVSSRLGHSQVVLNPRRLLPRVPQQD